MKNVVHKIRNIKNTYNFIYLPRKIKKKKNSNLTKTILYMKVLSVNIKTMLKYLFLLIEKKKYLNCMFLAGCGVYLLTRI